MSRPVVCGIEASTPQGVAQVAGSLAAKLGATVVLTTALEQPRLAGSHPQRERERHSAMCRAAEVMTQARYRVGGLAPVEDRITFGSPAATLIETARDENAELLVVGTRGLGPLVSALLGSVSRDLASNSPCPVVVVGQEAASNASRTEQSSVLCLLDDSAESDRVAAFGADLARRFGDRVVAVPTGSASGVETALTAIGTAPVEVAVQLTEGERDVDRLARREGARLIAMPSSWFRGLLRSHGRPLSAHGLRGSVAPIVVLPPAADIAPGTSHYQLLRAA